MPNANARAAAASAVRAVLAVADPTCILSAGGAIAGDGVIGVPKPANANCTAKERFC
jgi:hypothetical protein